MPLRRLSTYILLIVLMLIDSRQLNSKPRNIVALAAPFMLTAENNNDYTTSNDNANIIEDELINTINLPHLNMESGSDNDYNQLSLRLIPAAEDDFQHFTDAMMTPPNKLEQLERTKLSTILSNQPAVERRIPYTFYDEGTSTSGVYSNKGVAMPLSDHKESEEQQEVIDHVTNLIRSMREHAIGIIKDMNDLEMDFLYSTGSNIDSNENKNCNDNNSGNGFNGEITTATTPPINSLCFEPTSTTSPPSPSTANNCVNTSNKWNSSNGSNSNTNMNCKSSSNNLNNEKNEKKGNIPNYFVNEWSVPTTNEQPNAAVDAKEFMQQAHEAVKSWREQIEACKQILDAAVAQAAHTHHVTNGLFTGTEPMNSVSVANNVNKNCDDSTQTSVLMDGNTIGNNDANDSDKMKKHTTGTQHSENIAQNYDALINTLKGRMQGVWDLSTIH